MSNLITSAPNAWCMLHLSRELSLRHFSEGSCSQLRTFSTTCLLGKTAPSKARRYRAPYLINKAKARKAENVVRQEVLQKERAEARGDPIRGVTTPFVESFDTGFLSSSPSPSPDTSTTTMTQGSNNNNNNNETANKNPTKESLKEGEQVQLNYLVQHEELREAMKRVPFASHILPNGKDVDNADENQSSNNKKFESNVVAVNRILNLANGNALDLLIHNMHRCVETFGRHNTDKYLPPKPTSLMSAFYTDIDNNKKKKNNNNNKRSNESQEVPDTDIPTTTTTTTEPSQDLPSSSSSSSSPTTTAEAAPRRAGQDTGSSEVQIAILTAKIRALATGLEKTGRQDKSNKRNLRMLVHRRQKLLRYLRRKERGGPRWQNVVETLGLTEATWNGEISL